MLSALARGTRYIVPRLLNNGAAFAPRHYYSEKISGDIFDDESSQKSQPSSKGKTNFFEGFVEDFKNPDLLDVEDRTSVDELTETEKEAIHYMEAGRDEVLPLESDPPEVRRKKELEKYFWHDINNPDDLHGQIRISLETGEDPDFTLTMDNNEDVEELDNTISDLVTEEMIKILMEAEYGEALYPHVHPQLKKQMYKMWSSDPAEWTYPKLAQRFRLKQEKVKLILEHEAWARKELETNPENYPMRELGDALEQAYGEYVGMMGEPLTVTLPDGTKHFEWKVTSLDDRHVLADRFLVPPSNIYMPDEISPVHVFSCQIRAPKRKYNPTFLPINPTPEWLAHNLKQPNGSPVQQKIPVRKTRRLHSQKMLIDISDRPNKELSNAIIVREPEGNFRHGTYEERREIWNRQIRPVPEKPLPYRLKLDQIYFPMDEREMYVMVKQDRQRLEKVLDSSV